MAALHGSNLKVPYGGFHKWGYIPHSWMVKKLRMENPNLKWMMTGGTPMTGNH